MNPTQSQKIVSITPPAAIVDNASYTTASVDTKGWDYITFYVYIGATDIAFAALKVQESDTDGSYADITGADFGGLPGAGDDNKFVACHISLKGRKRYMDVVATAGDGVAGTYAAIWAVLSMGEIAPSSATTRGLLDEAIL